MRGHILSDEALDDLDDIYQYIARNNRGSAAKLMRELQGVFETIAVNPDIGRRYIDPAPGLHVFISGKYRIFYRVVKDDAIIVRVIHGARELSKIVFE